MKTSTPISIKKIVYSKKQKLKNKFLGKKHNILKNNMKNFIKTESFF